MEPAYDWNDLKVFLSCWRTGSLASAGRALGVDQTTAGRRLGALEDALGSRLFERTARKLVLTAAGESLLELAQSVEQQAIDLGGRASGADARLEGVVRLATTESLAVAFFARGLRSLHAAHPGIVVELITGNVSINLLRREADVALRAGPRPTQQSLMVRKAGHVEFALFAGPRYRRRPPGRLGPLDGHEVVGLCDEIGGSPGARWLSENGAGARVTLRCNSFLAAAEAVRGGWGVSALPSFLGDGLVRLRKETVAESDLWLVVHPELQHSGRVRAVIEHVTEVLRGGAVGLKGLA